MRGLQDEQLAECEAMLIEAAASEDLAGTPMVRKLPSVRGSPCLHLAPALFDR